jgi:hypothetical protein
VSPGFFHKKHQKFGKVEDIKEEDEDEHLDLNRSPKAAETV